MQMVTVRWWNASAYYAVTVAKALQDAGQKTLLVSPHHYPAAGKAREENIPVLSQVHTESVNPLQVFRNLVALNQAIQQHTIRVLNVHRPEDHAHAALMRAVMRLHCPVVRTITDVRYPKKNVINRYFHEHLTDFFIFSSRTSVHRYQSVWPIFEEEENFTIIPGALDVDYFQPWPISHGLRKKYGIGQSEVVFGLIARLSPVKGHRIFLEAAARVRKRFPNARFLISGEAVEITHEDLRETAKKLGIEQSVIFLEKRPDVREIIATIDVGVVASLDSEVVCRIGMEMMAMGKPVIATRVNVLQEIIESGKEGILVNPANPGELADAMEQLMKNSALREAMGKNARIRAESEFSLPVLAQKTIAAYQKAVQNFKRKHS